MLVEYSLIIITIEAKKKDKKMTQFHENQFIHKVFYRELSKIKAKMDEPCIMNSSLVQF
jgi:hypothetical protein